MKPKISVIIPVLNEAKRIGHTLAHLSAQPSAGPMEIILADGDPEGGTINAVLGQEIIRIMSHPGRGTQMNAGASTALGDILLFLHGDTFLPPDALIRIQDLVVAKGFKAGAFDLSIDAPGLQFRIIEKTASLRSRMTRIPYGDQAIFIRRDFFENIGRYREIPIMEDVDLMRRIKKTGEKIAIVRDPVRTSARRWQMEGVLKCTARNWILITLYLLGVGPERLARFYRVLSG